MKTKKIILSLLFFYSQLALVMSCSCERNYFCEHIKEENVKVAFMAKVLGKTAYTNNNWAAYLEVIKIYKDEFQITDTVKIYGRSQTGDCSVDVYYQFQDGDTTLVSIGQYGDGQDIVNPDSASENYWEYRPLSCDFVSLKVKNNWVFGWLQKDIYEYPLELFEAHLNDCGYSQQELQQIRCANDHFTVFPNPSVNGKVTIKGNYIRNPIERVSIFTMDGRLVNQYFNLEDKPYVDMEIEGFSHGLHILEILCDEKKYYRKLIIDY